MMRQLFFCLAVMTIVPVALAQAPSVDQAQRWIDATREVLMVRCAECHSPDSTSRSAQRHWLDAKDLALLRQDFVVDNGQMPGDVAETALWQVLTDEPDFRMPPPDSVSGPLTQAELLVLRRWLELGAPVDAGQAAPVNADAAGHSHEDQPQVGEPTLSTPKRAMRFFGRFHPAATHLPIGLLLAAAIAEALVLLTGSVKLAEARRYCTALGAVAALGAATLGWFNGEFHTASSTLTLHRWLGVGVVALAVLVVALGELARRPERRRARLCFRILLFATAGLIGFTGHLGGELVFGPDYYRW